MSSFLNKERPLVFCPGCTHERITKELDKALVAMGAVADKTVIVSDIGCSGLFDTFFNVHALHGLHGRALTYAQGLKLADPDLNVIVTMGDGGLGIGGAHVLAACRKNMDITLVVLNNFNFGMTGGQYSSTTPRDAVAGSGFLNSLEMPMSICDVAESAGATYVSRCSGHDSRLSDILAQAMAHKGFSLVETLGLCTGRYTKKNQLTPKAIDEMVEVLPEKDGVVEKNARPEYTQAYRDRAAVQNKFPDPVTIESRFDHTGREREEIIILGSAGMRIVTAGDLICRAGISAGMNVSMKNDYNITVLRGQSVSEIMISKEAIGYAGIESPSIVIAISEEGVQRRKDIFASLNSSTIVLREKDIAIPETGAAVYEVDFKALKIKKHDWALASLAILARENLAITRESLFCAITTKFNEKVAKIAMETVETCFEGLSCKI